MKRYIVIILISLLPIFNLKGEDRQHIVVIDSTTLQPLPSATIFDSQGNTIGTTNKNGRLPYIPHRSFPITVRYLGFEEKSVAEQTDTIRLSTATTELPEVVVESKHHKVLHILAYIREYSTLSTYTDTIFLFREKMVDFMLLPDKSIKFNGWNHPRLLKANSYYRFTNNQGLDSVSDRCGYHFSWSDWINIVPSPKIPESLTNVETGSYTLSGKYSPAEVWRRDGENISVDINVLADTLSRKWVKNLRGFFQSGLEYETLKLRYNYGNIVGNSIAMTDITGYSYNIDSRGRGHNMLLFNKLNEPFFVSTYAEVYITDKEFIKIKEAKQWAKMKFDQSNIEIIEPANAPELQIPIKRLIARINNIDHANVRQNVLPDQRLKTRNVRKQQHIGHRVLNILKGITGISSYKSKRNLEQNWETFKKGQTKNNEQK